MDLLRLRYFQVAARHEHISQAAQELCIAQPSLSRAIARLEAELGVLLFDRQGRQVRLNQFGTAFLRRVDRALRELDDGRLELLDAAGLEHGSITIASETQLTLTSVLKGFMAEQPGVTVRLNQLSADLMARQLRAGEIDLCLASQPIGGPPLVTFELVQEKVFLAVPVSHPLAGAERVSLEDIADEPIVATREGYWQRTLTDQLFESAGLRPNITCEGNEPGATQDLIGAGLGIGLLPQIGRTAATHTPVSWLELDAPGCVRTLSLVWNEESYLSVAAERFRDFAIRHFRNNRE
ncbi:LysR family transcriptional regulator [Saccharopolyspora taberi]|uniref:LysR substrate-binding domain-containing protein n=1 Tax=Saccharopolyspora taberi TaxID=60895 RepID=A0ABN3VGU3_9PSEU